MYKLLCIGKLKENYWTEAIKEYKKRIDGFQKMEIIELKEYNTGDIAKNIENEGKEILDRLTKEDYVITLEIEGKPLDSLAFSAMLENLPIYGHSKIAFVIGGSNGLSQAVKARSNYALSFSNMTFPHQLMRVIVLEQIYRAITIMNHKEYHK
ncbi:MAG: 23S rRNA (pseudouridine(1915)-N(3))-methyltransferase RlmH [Prevotella sp.]|nr:23S rRNA (pseudouridine(1915)-N(3))-methyltransferase RlmH [Prevotella sp.]